MYSDYLKYLLGKIVHGFRLRWPGLWVIAYNLFYINLSVEDRLVINLQKCRKKFFPRGVSIYTLIKHLFIQNTKRKTIKFTTFYRVDSSVIYRTTSENSIARSWKSIKIMCENRHLWNLKLIHIIVFLEDLSILQEMTISLQKSYSIIDAKFQRWWLLCIISRMILWDLTRLDSDSYEILTFNFCPT